MTNQAKYRVVLDTNQIIAAGSKCLVEPPPSPTTEHARLVREVAYNHIGLYSSAIAGEYLEKLIDRKHPKKRVIEFIGCIMEIFELVLVTSKSCPHIPSDPDDVKFVLCAIDGKANFLVTDDKHLLRLKEHYEAPRIGRREDFWGDLCEASTEVGGHGSIPMK